jgi:hypothetical protein
MDDRSNAKINFFLTVLLSIWYKRIILKKEEKMIYYKGTWDLNSKGDFKYEVGKKYNFNGYPEFCKKGFHFCKNPDNIFYYFPSYSKLNNNFVLLEIRVEDNCIKMEREIKCVCNSIDILRIVPVEEYPDIFNRTILNSDGNPIYEQYEIFDFSFHNIYDQYGKIIEKKYSNKCFEIYEYNDYGQISKIILKSNEQNIYTLAFPVIYSYDSDHRISEINFADGRFIKYKYNNGKIEEIEEKLQRGVVSEIKKKTYYYNEDGTISYISINEDTQKFVYKDGKLIEIRYYIKKQLNWSINIFDISR